MLGFLNVNKPVGMTSRQIVTLVQRRVKPTKVGHAGTLDPLASGVLLVAVGSATRLIPDAQRLPKTYDAEFQFGRSSDGDDLEGEVREHPELPVPTDVDVKGVLPEFVGEIDQIPPRYSAVKVGGHRAYHLARKGHDVSLNSRKVRIDQVELLEYTFPRLRVRISCGSGTYIRALGRDLAERLGTKAIMSSLVRTAIGPFQISESIDCDRLQAEPLERHLHSPLQVLSGIAEVHVDDEGVHELRHGRPCLISPTLARGEAIAVDNAQQLIAIGEVQDDGTRFQPRKLFTHAAH